MPRFTDFWYNYFLELPYRRAGEQNLKKIKANSPTLEEWEKRAKIIREGILKGAQLSPFPKKTPLNTLIHSRRELNGYSVENVRIETVPGFFLSGNLYRPLNIPKNQLIPVILTPHGHFKNGRMIEAHQQMNATLTRMGIITFIYDMVGFGENNQVDHKYPYTLMFQLWNSIRALDFLLTQDNADKKRVGMTGESGGGTQTFFCTAVDDRITASAPLIMVSSGFFGGCTCENKMPVHYGSNPDYATNNAEISAVAAPRPQLLVSDGKDWTRLVPYREYPFIRSRYALFGAESKVENIHIPNEGHDLGPSKRQPVYSFFARTFGLDISSMRLPGGLVDESPNKILSEEDLHVYTKDHPLPSIALKNGDEVYQIFKELKK
jgi:hypothetical protein